MTIKRKVEIDESEERKKREEFILKGGQVSGDKKEKGEFSNVLIRIPQAMLDAIDQRVKRKPWMNRTQWILEAIDSQLEDGF
jgi:hypothetical protein